MEDGHECAGDVRRKNGPCDDHRLSGWTYGAGVVGDERRATEKMGGLDG